MTVKEIAEYLKLSSDLIYRLAQQGKIPVSKVGNRWRFNKDRVDQWMEEQDTSASSKKRVDDQRH